MAGAALGLLATSLVGGTPLELADAAPPASTTVISAPVAAAAKSNRAAVRYHWGKVVAGDEFNYKGAPDKKKWRVFKSAGHNGHGLRRPSAIHVNGTAVTLTGNSHGTTGGMASLYGRKYGRWEARMKTNARDSEYHPDILLWPHAHGAKNCPEINFAEGTNNTTQAKFYLHYLCHGRQQQQGKKVVDMKKWHNYAVEWTPAHVIGYIDGVEFFRYTKRSHIPAVAMHACVQLDWFPDKTETTTSTMTVDWIRVYKA